jgi:hypothetical protein
MRTLECYEQKSTLMQKILNLQAKDSSDIDCMASFLRGLAKSIMEIITELPLNLPEALVGNFECISAA